jgi:hypothetical protein
MVRGGQDSAGGGGQRAVGGRGSWRRELRRLFAGPSRGRRPLGDERRLRRVRFPLALAVVLLSVTLGTMAPAAAPPRAEAAPVSGNTKWAIIACKFQDVAGEPKALSVLRDFFSESGAGKGGVFDYFKDVSYGAIDLTGSTVHGWYTMPFTLQQHLNLGGPQPGGRPQKLQACVDAAMKDPHFPASMIASSYYGIVVFWNDDAGQYWGGQQSVTIGGTTRTFGTAALTASSLRIPTAAQEMMHGYGLYLHSRCYDGAEYGDAWDVMSADTFGSGSTCGYANPTFQRSPFGQSGPGLIAPYRAWFGWIPASRIRYTAGPATVTLAALDDASRPGDLMVQVPIGLSSAIYTVEFRRRAGWDQGLPADAVVVHQVLPGGQTYLMKSGSAGRTGLGVGDTFADPAVNNNVGITVLGIDRQNGTATVWIGGVPPVSTATLSPALNAVGWTNRDTTVTISAQVSGSSSVYNSPTAIQSITYESVAGSAQLIPRTAAGGASTSVVISKEGQTTLRFWAMDNAGNVEYPKQVVVRLDKTAPRTSASTAGGVLMLSASDGGSGVKQIQYQMNGGPVQTVLGSYAQLSVPSPGPTDVFFWATDQAGNVEPMQGMRFEARLLVSPTSLSFGSQVFGTTSAPQTVTLKNGGNLNLTIKSFGTSDPQFGTTSAGVAMPCGTPPITLAPNAFCNVGVTFSPTGPYPAGPRTAVLGISHDGNNGTSRAGETSVPLDGVAKGVPTAKLSPTTLAFPRQRVGATGTLGLYLTNDGTDTLSISGISIGGTNAGEFAISTAPAAPPLVACGVPPTTLAAGQSCVIVVAFTPSVAGQRSATLTITHNANNVPGSQSTVTLDGTGVEPTITLTPSALSFGTLKPGAISAPQQVTLTAGGQMELMIYGFGVSGTNAADFWIEGDVRCSPRPAVLTPGYSLDPGAMCTFNLVFRPSAAGARSATLEIATNATPGVHTVALSGSGASAAPPPAPAVSLDPMKWDFGEQPAGTTSHPVEVALTNSGGAKLQIKGVWVSGKFAADFPILKESCSGAVLAPGTACVVYVAFAPAGPDLRWALLEFHDDAADSPQQVELAGYGAVYE